MQQRQVDRTIRRSLSVPRPAPTAGWNPRDPRQAMATDEAIQLDNWFPDAGFLKVRPGYEDHATGVGSGLVETLAEFRGAASRKLIAKGGGTIYDASAAGAATSLKTGYTENADQTVNFNAFLVGCNGTDTPWNYDGTTVADSTHTGPTITDLINVTNYKSRIYYVEKNKASFWYGGVGEVTGGVLTEFPLGEIAQFGGKLMAQGEWSTVKGDALQGVLVNIMDTGEVIVYSGDDPGANFTLVGRYKTARPIGRRCLVQVQNDLVILTEGGLFPVSLLVDKGIPEAIEQLTIWGKIRPAFRDAARLYAANEGWEVYLSPLGDFALWNVPELEGSRWSQIVLNPVTGAWCRYTDLPALSWASLAGESYFGSSDGTVRPHRGVNDDGAAIVAFSRGAFDYFGQAGLQKQITAVGPSLTSDGIFTGTVGVDVDFSERTFPLNAVTFGATASSTPWGSVWDSPWGTEAQAQNDFYSVSGVGTALSLFLQTSSSAQGITWAATRFLGQIGSIG